MKAILGKHYEGYKAVSAQAAFYGLSSALLPESDFYKNKQKFLEIFKAEELLLKSHFKQLGEFIAGTLLENSRKKIIESNCNKALKVIEKLQKAITTTNDFLKREIGEEGININTRVQNAFERETQGILNEIAKIGTSFNADRSLFEKHAGTLGKIGNELLTKSGLINATNIKLTRDAIAAVGKFVGIDLAFKFKPWGAVKLAGDLNKALPFIGFAFEAWDSYNKYQKEQKLEEAKKEMVSNFDNQKKEILDLINDETRFKQTCFLSALELEKSLQEIKEAIKKMQACDQEFEKWIKAGEDLIKGEDFIEVDPEEE